MLKPPPRKPPPELKPPPEPKPPIPPADERPRIAAEEADALGKEPHRAPQLGEDATDQEVEATVVEQLRTVFDPEIPVNIVDLGLVYAFRA